MKKLRYAITLIFVIALFWTSDRIVDRMAKAWGIDLPGVQDAELPIRFTFLSPAQLQQMMETDQSFTLLDVREAGEFHTGHIVGAINIPYHQIRQQAATLDRDKPLVVYCIKAGRRSIIAANTLTDLGFPTVYNVDGGMVGWEKAFPLVVTSAKD